MPPSSYSATHKLIHPWYNNYGRLDLPWRNTTDPYHIYLSEIMLQQTQVKTVLEQYYAPFLKQFPTLFVLAKANESDVLKAWEGLGYYTRARNLHKAAKLCNGVLPKNVDELILLPGIGKNTAHAIAAFAYHQPVPVMEANVKRILCRVFAFKNPNDDTLWNAARTLLDTNNPFDYNQAMMDIGAMVCTKTSPKCDVCPLTTICTGQKTPEHYPAKKIKKQTPIRKKHIVVYQNPDGHYFLQKRSSQFLNGLYGFVEHDKKPEANMQVLGHITQVYSHFKLDAKVYLCPDGNRKGKYFDFDAIQKLPLSRADLKVVRLLQLRILASEP